MALIWRGAGIVVPIFFFITGWIVSYWYDSGETTLGNASFIGWTSLFSGIVILLIGLGLRGSQPEDGGPKKRHEFFFLPVFVWGLLLGGLSLYLLVFAGKPSTSDTDQTDTSDTEDTQLPPTTRMVNFYNPTNDTITYVVADETADGLISRKKVPGKSYLSLELEKGTYLFTAFNQSKETTLILPDREFAGDEEKYKFLEDEKGSFYQRILNPATKETDDYDEAWLVLNGKQDLLLIDLASVCGKDISPAEVEAINWEDEIQDRYDARDLIEPLYNTFKKDKNIRVLAMGEKLPSPCTEKDMFFLLVPDPGEEDLNAGIAAAVAEARFP